MSMTILAKTNYVCKCLTVKKKSYTYGQLIAKFIRHKQDNGIDGEILSYSGCTLRQQQTKAIEDIGCNH